jgi:hypothetical protein
MNLKKIGKVFTSKFVGTGLSSFEKNNVPGRGLTKLRNTDIEDLNTATCSGL